MLLLKPWRKYNPLCFETVGKIDDRRRINEGYTMLLLKP